jgi:Mg-chelatase subunit ChlD
VIQGNPLTIDKKTAPSNVFLDSKGLAKEDITIELTINTKPIKKIPADIVIAIDCSASMSLADKKQIRKNAAKQFISDLAQFMTTTDRVGVLLWNNDTIYSNPLTHSSAEIISLLDKMPAIDEGGTDLDKALQNSIEMLNADPRANGPHISRSIIFLTDALPEGGDNGYNYKKETLRAALEEDAKQNREGDICRIYPIGINAHPTGWKDLEDIAESSGGWPIYTENANELIYIFKNLCEIVPYEIISTDAKIIDILPPYLNLKEPSEINIQVPYKYIKTPKTYETKVDPRDNSTIISLSWGTLIAHPDSSTITFKTKFKSILPADLIIGEKRLERKEINSVLTYTDYRGIPQQIQIPAGEFRLNGSLGFMGWLLNKLGIR